MGLLMTKIKLKKTFQKLKTKSYVNLTKESLLNIQTPRSQKMHNFYFDHIILKLMALAFLNVSTFKHYLLNSGRNSRLNLDTVHIKNTS